MTDHDPTDILQWLRNLSHSPASSS